MKVIAAIDDENYICQISHRELEQFLNLYYNKLKKLKVGDSIDLNKGYEFHRHALDAMKKTDDFLQANKDVLSAIFDGISIASRCEGKP